VTDVFDAAARGGVVPVIAIEDVSAALPLADAILAGGLAVIEIAFRTTAAEDVIATLRQARPNLLVGAGTVLSADQIARAHRAGAAFAVAPGLNPETVRIANEVGLPFAPGVATPSDVEAGLALGCRYLKLFPAGVVGGPAMLKALAGPYGHTGVRFIPTGGVTQDNLAEYLALDNVAACGGTWIARAEDIRAERWDVIRERCAAARAVVEGEPNSGSQ